MPVESASYVSELEPLNPVPGDGLGEGDNHIRLIKSAIKASFPNIAGGVVADHEHLSRVSETHQTDGVLRIPPAPESSAEGGELVLSGAGTNRDAFVDNLSGDVRIVSVAKSEESPDPRVLATFSPSGAANFSGPTPEIRLNGTSLFASAVIPRGVVMAFFGAANDVPAGWAICNGSNGTPDLQDRTIVGAGGVYAPAAVIGTLATTTSEVRPAAVALFWIMKL